MDLNSEPIAETRLFWSSGGPILFTPILIYSYHIFTDYAPSAKALGPDCDSVLLVGD